MPSPNKLPQLPVTACDGCGVCCFHMGYPAFIRPVDPVDASQIDAMERKQGRKFSASQRADLIAGRVGETYWHLLPEDLRQELDRYVASYQPPEYGGEIDTFDGPCIWLDLESRRCRHHQHRPSVCRDFETGNPQCHQWRDVYAERILETEGAEPESLAASPLPSQLAKQQDGTDQDADDVA